MILISEAESISLKYRWKRTYGSYEWFRLTSHIDRQYSPDQWARINSCIVNKQEMHKEHDMYDFDFKTYVIQYWFLNMICYDMVYMFWMTYHACYTWLVWRGYSLSGDSYKSLNFSRLLVNELQVILDTVHRQTGWLHSSTPSSSSPNEYRVFICIRCCGSKSTVYWCIWICVCRVTRCILLWSCLIVYFDVL